MGGIHTLIYYNKFVSHVGDFADEVKANASDIYTFMPENYFTYS